jgi:endonuclease/exonuclease/phosphatase family metal-dependent hydrolase
MDRADDFRRVIEWVRPDAVCMQEIHAEDAVDVLLSFAYLPVDSDWAAAVFFNGPDTDNAFFYRTSKMSLYSQREISTSLRDISEYVVQPNALPTGERIRLYSAHLKASSGADNAERRRQEAAALRQQLNLLDPGALFMLMGDFNLYTSEEPAYQLLLSASPDPDGQLFDPIDRPGNWSNNISFAGIHTQSPRVESFGGGTTGGMDDRFDFILVSSALLDTAFSYAVTSSYRVVGNDGQHFNLSINNGTNLVVPDSIADALYYAADHLPVQCDFVLRPSNTAADDAPRYPMETALVTCYPNPFNPVLNVRLDASLRDANIDVFDRLGRLVAQQHAVRGDTHLDLTAAASGAYFVRVTSGSRVQTVRTLLLK